MTNMPRVLICGVDGYIGWPLALYLSEQGFPVAGLDCFAKRWWEEECGVAPLIPLPLGPPPFPWYRKRFFDSVFEFKYADLECNSGLGLFIKDFKPDAVVHLAEQPSAPYSMKDEEAARDTLENNILGTLNLAMALKRYAPGAHLIKLGTMGEYGTPNIDIEEGWLDLEHNGRRDRVLYPKRPASLYHASKVADSTNLEFLCRAWGLRVTDLNQGIVYGTHTAHTNEPGRHTSFHYDSIFGTCLNRFLAQATLGVDLTVYGSGQQTRGFIFLEDSLKCIELAILNPAAAGEFRVFNQFTEQFSVRQLAKMVCELTGAKTRQIENPRVEADAHYYNAKHTALPSLGLQPQLLTRVRLGQMLAYIEPHKANIDPTHLEPKIKWNWS